MRFDNGVSSSSSDESGATAAFLAGDFFAAGFAPATGVVAAAGFFAAGFGFGFSKTSSCDGQYGGGG